MRTARATICAWDDNGRTIYLRLNGLGGEHDKGEGLRAQLQAFVANWTAQASAEDTRQVYIEFDDLVRHYAEVANLPQESAQFHRSGTATYPLGWALLMRYSPARKFWDYPGSGWVLIHPNPLASEPPTVWAVQPDVDVARVR